MKEFVQALSRRGPIVMSAMALGLLVFAWFTGWGRGPAGDEGAAAHLWQLLIGLQLPLILIFIVTADWRRPLEPVKVLVLQAAALFAAMAPLYIAEHYLALPH